MRIQVSHWGIRFLVTCMVALFLFAVQLEAGGRGKRPGLFDRRIASTVTDPRPGQALDPFDYQARIIIRLRRGYTLADIEPAIPEHFQVVSAFDMLVVVQSPYRVGDYEINYFRNLPQVSSADRDYLVELRQDQAQESFDPASCPFADICSNNGKTKLWAQHQVGANLALTAVRSWEVPLDTVKVAVIDSGFDKRSFESRFSQVRTVTFLDSVTPYDKNDQKINPNLDQAGHGTAVAGMVAGLQGVGIAPGIDLTVYRVKIDFGAGVTAIFGSWVENTIVRACVQDHAQIINVSLGNKFEEEGTSPYLSSGVRARLTEAGCFVTQSAGNSGIKERNAQFDDADDAMLVVSASEEAGFEANFSTIGEVHAPGQDVYTFATGLIGTLVRNPGNISVRKARICEESDSTGGFISGTSFAAPTMAGITALVVGVLQPNATYANLSGPDKIKLLNRILRAAVYGPTVNAYKAVWIARQWGLTHNRGDNIESIAVLRRLAYNSDQGFCPDSDDDVQEIPLCTASTDCDERRHRFDHERKLMIRCERQDSRLINDLITGGYEAKNMELSLGWLGLLHAVDPGGSHTLALPLHNYYRNTWLYKRQRNRSQINVPDWSIDNIYHALPFFMNVSSDEDVIKRTVVEDLSLLLAGERWVEELDDEAQHDIRLRKVANLFVQAFQKLGSSEFEMALRDIAVAISMDFDLDKAVSLGTVLGTLLENNEFNTPRRLKNILRSVDHGYFTTVTQQTDVVEDATNDVCQLYFSSDLEGIKEEVAQKLRRNELSELGFPIIHCVAKEADLILVNSDLKKNFILQTIDDGREDRSVIWNRQTNMLTFFPLIKDMISNVTEPLTDAQKLQFFNEFGKRAGRVNNLILLTGLKNIYPWNEFHLSREQARNASFDLNNFVLNKQFDLINQWVTNPNFNSTFWKIYPLKLREGINQISRELAPFHGDPFKPQEEILSLLSRFLRSMLDFYYHLNQQGGDLVLRMDFLWKLPEIIRIIEHYVNRYTQMEALSRPQRVQLAKTFQFKVRGSRFYEHSLFDDNNDITFINENESYNFYNVENAMMDLGHRILGF